MDVSQGVPGSGPVASLKTALANSASSDPGSAYGPIQGETELRILLAGEMKAVYGEGIDVSDKDIALTAGCNLAFFAVVLSLAQPGDEIILPVPWYFNHQMTLEMLGITIVPLPLWPENQFHPTVQECEKLITPRTRGLVLVSPNNPTGSIYSPKLLASFAQLASTHSIALILDETYRDFVVSTAESPHPHDLFSSQAVPQWRSNLIHLFSFSKSYAIPGQRLGAIVAAPSFLNEVTTVLDSIQICPPRAVQIALSSSSLLPTLRPHLIETAQVLARRHLIFRSALESSSAPEGGATQWTVGASGGYFAFVRHPFTNGDGAPIPGEEVCRRVAVEAGVVMLPATFFAPARSGNVKNPPKPDRDFRVGNNEAQTGSMDDWSVTKSAGDLVVELDRWVRVSVANVNDDQIILVANRLRAFTMA